MRFSFDGQGDIPVAAKPAVRIEYDRGFRPFPYLVQFLDEFGQWDTEGFYIFRWIARIKARKVWIKRNRRFMRNNITDAYY